MGKLGNAVRLHKDGNSIAFYPKWRVGPKQEFMYGIESV